MSKYAAPKSWSAGNWFEDFVTGFAAYYLSSLLVFVGLLFGVRFLKRGESEVDLVSACVHYDATHYLEIIREGYSYDPDQRSMVAFFPAYPLLARWASLATKLPPEEAALLTANIFLVAAFVLLAGYVRVRWPGATNGQRGAVLAGFGLWPLGLFFRMPYAESLLVCITLALLYGMARGWSTATLALLAGLGTASRPVGIALTAAVTCHLLTQPSAHWRAKATRVLVWVPIACWGLLAYVLFQWVTFGAPFAFFQTQEHWGLLAPEDRSWQTKSWSLITMEPVWGVYLPSSQRYWQNIQVPGGPIFSLIFWNPILFVFSAGLLLLGYYARWLNTTELVLGACLLIIPYLTRGYEMSMASHGRFAAVVVVDYLVLGRIFAAIPYIGATLFYAALGLFLGLVSSLYAAGYLIF